MEFLLWPVFLTYVILILAFIIGFDAHGNVELTEENPTSKFSIVVAFRNEAHNLENLLASIKELDYPASQFELILVNDFSTDEFQPIVQNFQEKHPEIKVTILQNESGMAPKKIALNLGIEASLHPFIITTDADCTVPRLWLRAFDTLIRQKPTTMICAPVSILPKKGWINTFQMLNFNSLQGSTIGSFGIQMPFICNGANLCYRKETFNEVKGFQGNETISSGDDVFLLEKFLKNDKNRVHFLKSERAIVQTKAQDNFHGFVRQQVRWAKKSSAYNFFRSKLIGLLVFLTNLFVILGLGLVLFNALSAEFFLACLLFKLLVDVILIHKTNSFFKQPQLHKYILLAAMLYPFFLLLVAFRAIGQKVAWKGRTFSR